MNLTPADLNGWFPAKILWEAGEPAVVWQPASSYLRERSFDGIIRSSDGTDSEANSFHTPIAMLREVALLPSSKQAPSPSGFLFHWSRSGSTLVAQALAAEPAHVVLAGFQPVDALLRCHLWDARVTPAWQEEQFRWWLRAVARCAQGRTRLFLRLDAWQVLQLPVIRAAFPEVPWLFFYRDPLFVLASHEHRCGADFVPGELEPELFGWTQAEVMRRPFQVHWAMLLAAFGQAALAGFATGGGQFINHAELPGAIADVIPQSLGLSPIPDAGGVTEQQLRAREPKSMIGATTESLRQEFPDHARATEQHVREVYGQLQAARKAADQLRPPLAA